MVVCDAYVCAAATALPLVFSDFSLPLFVESVNPSTSKYHTQAHVLCAHAIQSSALDFREAVVW